MFVTQGSCIFRNISYLLGIKEIVLNCWMDVNEFGGGLNKCADAVIL